MITKAEYIKRLTEVVAQACPDQANYINDLTAEMKGDQGVILRWEPAPYGAVDHREVGAITRDELLYIHPELAA